MENTNLYKSIDLLVSKGESIDRINQRLRLIGWPQDKINEVLDFWLEKNGRKTQTTSFKDWLKKYHKQALKGVIVVVVLNSISSAIDLLKPWPTKILADSVFGGEIAPGMLAPYTGTAKLILIVSAINLGLFIIGWVFEFGKDFILIKIGYSLNRSIKEESFRHIIHLPLFHPERLSKGDYAYRQNVVTSSLSELVLSSTSSIIQSIIMVLGVFAIMLKMNVKLAFISIVVVPFLYMTIQIIGPIIGKVAKELAKLASDTATHITESIDNAETLQAFTLEEMQVNKLNELWNKNYIYARKSMFWGKIFNFSNGFMVVLGTSAVMLVGGTAVLNGTGMSLGKLLIFMTYMGYLLGPIEEIAEQITSRKQKLMEVSRVYDVLSDHENIEFARVDQLLPEKIEGRIEFQHVSYNYNDRVVLDDVSIVIEPGTKIGIIGPSGGGKSTFLKLLPLFIEPTTGRVLIDGIDMQSVSLKDLRKRIGWISQTPQLFGASIKTNVLWGDIYREISQQSFDDAIEGAYVSEFLGNLPMGIDSPAGENGSSLSGGQRQRISIARALVKNAPIICMDEPTSALDNKSETYITDSIGSLVKGKTVVLVTHRKSLLVLMDKIFVLEGGKLRNVDEYGGYETYMHYLQAHEQI
jgi:ATP-binding cassette, subfamily B, bacterial